MSHRIVTLHEWTCDGCKSVLVSMARDELPADWKEGWIDLHNCGLTGYTKRVTTHHCETCISGDTSRE